MLSYGNALLSRLDLIWLKSRLKMSNKCVSSREIGINGLASFVLRFAVKHCAITTRSGGGGGGGGGCEKD